MRKTRRKRGLTIVQLSELSGVSNPYISQLENGKHEPSLEIIAKLAKGLEIDESILFFSAGYLFDVNADPEKYLEVQEQLSTVKGRGKITKQDLYLLLNSNGDLYYKDELISDEEKKKILTIISTILDD